ncbi:alpha/beta fold hydrolase [Paraburkholderia bryophila]|uniref:Pimeloyl-ACP methyl ester carboxylesterase n=1 Tax=Paraburkholderia bryophila TaxID=420952 RepID=A0A329BG54_9BURK|nr:alpha/beta hydrolase [Paraburkholderia bryophila]RAS21228.1 pimeloyl-ACP methyl ester carboxylesterase [Paraburkholderia bryophila]
MDSHAPTLFLHGGPGLSAIAERALYGLALPIHWWDQPRSVVLFARPFAALVDAAQEEVERLAHAYSQPVNLVAHAFGAHLALRLAMRLPNRLGKIVLLAPVYDLADAFVRFATCLCLKDQSYEPFLVALDEFRASRDVSRFARVAAQIASIASFVDLSWSPGASASRHWYVNLLAHQPVFDLNTFEVVVKDFLLEDPIPVATTVADSVHLILGNKDPFTDIKAESRIWVELFPNAVSYLVDSGHFVHLERPSEVWWKTRRSLECKTDV